MAASVYSDRSFVRSWISTANGLAAVAAEQHDMMLGLDEIGLARSEDVDIATYHIVAGTSKLRATESGGLAKPSHWRTLALSTGEIWLSEVFESLGKRPKAGQQIRLVEVPVFGQFGAFDVLHRFQRPQLFVDHVKFQTGQYHGSLFPEWMNLLTSTTNEPERATLKLMVNGKSRRFFALLPDRIFAGIQELEIDD